MTTDSGQIVFTDVSKFYGEVLGVNKVNLKIGPGITVWWARMVPVKRP